MQLAYDLTYNLRSELTSDRSYDLDSDRIELIRQRNMKAKIQPQWCNSLFVVVVWM